MKETIMNNIFLGKIPNKINDRNNIAMILPKAIQAFFPVSILAKKALYFSSILGKKSCWKSCVHWYNFHLYNHINPKAIMAKCPIPRPSLESYTFPKMTKIAPIIPKIIEYILAERLVTFLSSISIEPPVMAAFTIIATNNEAPKVTESVNGK